MEYNDFLKEITERIEKCKSTADELKKSGFESSSSCSEAMAFAYSESLKLVNTHLLNGAEALLQENTDLSNGFSDLISKVQTLKNEIKEMIAKNNELIKDTEEVNYKSIIEAKNNGLYSVMFLFKLNDL